jgi:hypothetical protein
MDLGVPGGPGEERVAIFKDRFVALFACAVHILPLVATVVMGYYIFNEHWIGAQVTDHGAWDSEAKLGLQFAAKILEVIIVASLATMIFTFARYEAILGRGAPLASFLAGTDFSSPSCLWSEGLLAMLTGRFSSAGRKVFFLLFTAVCCLLAFVVAPATATVLLPIEDWYVLSGTRMYLNTTDVDPYPRVITTENNTPSEDACRGWGRAYCPSDGWEFVRELVAPLASRDAPTHLSRTVARNVARLKGYGYNIAAGLNVCVPRESYMSSPNQRNVTIISIPHHAKAEALMYSSTIWGRALDLAEKNGNFYRGSTHRIKSSAEQIAVETICTVQTDRDGYQNSSSLTFPDVRGTGHDARDVGFSIENPEFVEFLAQLNGSRAELQFFDLPEDLQAVASVGAVAALPRPEGPPTVLGCLLNAQWHKTPFTYNIDNREIWTEQEPNDHGWYDAKGIRVSTSFVNLTNLPIEDAILGNSSIFEELVKVSAAGTLLDLVAGDPGSASIPCVIEAVLNAMLGNGLARTTPQIGPFLALKKTDDWWKSFFPPPNQTFGFITGQTIFDLPEDLVQSGHWIDMVAEMFGFAYTSRDRTVRYSMIGLFVHSFIAVCYILWSVAVGVTSSTWQSTPEIVALAMRSPPPGHDKMPTSIDFGTQGMKQTYALVAEGDEIRLQWLKSNERVPPEKRVKPNLSYM